MVICCWNLVHLNESSNFSSRVKLYFNGVALKLKSQIFFEISKHLGETRLLFFIFVKLWASILVTCRWIFFICMHVFMWMTLLVLIMLSTDLANETWPKEGSNLGRIFICKISPLKTRGLSHRGLAIYSKKYLKAKEELWKLKYFTMQKYNLQKIL